MKLILKATQQDLIQKAYDPEHFRRLGHQLVDLLADYLSASHQQQTQNAFTWIGPDKNLEQWQLDWEEGGDVTAFFQQVLQESVNIHHPNYMGHQIGPPVPITALAGLLSDFLNNGMGVYEMGIHSSALEKLVIKLVADQMGLSSNTDGVLTSGGTLGNLTALLAARSNVAKSPIWKEGASGQLALMVSEQAHYCVDRAVRIMGWGDAGIIKVPVNEDFQMDTSLLESLYLDAQTRGIEVIAVVGSACSTSTGSFDDLNAIADFTARHQLWFHVDGAHGAPFTLSRQYKSLVNGLERADSIVMDFHKSLAIPAITTALFFKNGQLSFRTFQQRADYLFNEHETEWHNLAKRTFECTKLMMSVKVYTLLKMHGFEFWDQYVTKLVDLGKLFTQLLSRRPDFELALLPACNIVCFRLKHRGGEQETNLLNENIRAALLEEGRFYIVKTKLKSVIWLRCTLTNPFSGEAEINALLDRIESLGAAFAKKEKAEQ